MPDFETHFDWGKRSALVAYALASFALFEFSIVGPTGILALGLGFIPVALVSSSLPDTDHKDSIPRRIFGKVGIVSIPVIAMAIILFDNPVHDVFVARTARLVASITSAESALTVEFAIVGLLVGSLIFGVLYTLDEMKHRGILHNPIAAFFLGGLLVYFVYTYWGDIVPQLTLVGIGLGTVFGYFTHLQLDDELNFS
jgi:membrane-bound metal-dependent hydrolase YbcI (DUF457 family)